MIDALASGALDMDALLARVYDDTPRALWPWRAGPWRRTLESSWQRIAWRERARGCPSGRETRDRKIRVRAGERPLMELEREILKTFTTVAAPDEVLNLLANVPDSARHMPDVETVVANDDGHCWTMKKLGAGKISHQATYTSRFVADASVARSPGGPAGTSRFLGARPVARGGSRRGSVVHLRSSFSVRLPFLRC